MPRVYKRAAGSRSYADYSTAKLTEAVDKICKHELSYRKASEQYKIPVSTLRRKVKGLHSKDIGGQAAIDFQTEGKFVNYVIKCSEFGFPLDSFDLRVLVKSYLDRKGFTVKCFKNNLPGGEWVRGFIRRHPSLTERFASNIKKQRAAVSADVMNEYFDHLEKEMVQEFKEKTTDDGEKVTEAVLSIPPSNIYNYDETNLTDDPGQKRVITKRGTKYPERILNTSKSSTSIMFCGNAEGKILPPYVVYKSKEMWNSWVEGGPSGCRYNKTASGWFDSVTFDDWFNSVFIPTVKHQSGTKLVIGDNLSSHLNLNVIKQCQQYNIKFVCLPPNSTHLTQPFDLAFFRPMKRCWREVLQEYKVKFNRSPVPKSDFPKLLGKLMDKCVKDHSQSLVGGFRKAGIVPFNRSAVIDRLPSKDTPQDTNDDSVISESVLEFLHEKRYSTAQPKTRRKKVNVTPGKSVATEDFEKTSDVDDPAPVPVVVNPAPRTKKASKKAIESETSSEDNCTTYSEYSEFECEDFDESEQEDNVFNNGDLRPSTSSKKVPLLVVGKSKLEELKEKKTKNKSIAKNKTKSKAIPVQKKTKMCPEIGDFVIVEYEGEFFPGNVEDTSGDEYKVSTMCMSGATGWKWPEKVDCCWYNIADVKEIIPVPVLVNLRGVVQVPNITKWRQKQNKN